MKTKTAPKTEPKKRGGHREGSGRKPRVIDWSEMERLCALQCTITEIADWFSVSPQTIENHCLKEQGVVFSQYFEKNSAMGKISLRRNLFRMSENNPGVAIFLGKNYLGMSDQQEIKHIGIGKDVSEYTDAELVSLITKRRGKRMVEAAAGTY